MIDKNIIEEIKNRLVKTYNPLEIYLFGSYAWGTPDEESDIDLVIVVNSSDEKKYKRPIQGYEALRGLRVSNDIIVYTKDEFEKRAKDITTLVYKIKKEGKRIYAKA